MCVMCCFTFLHPVGRFQWRHSTIRESKEAHASLSPPLPEDTKCSKSSSNILPTKGSRKEKSIRPFSPKSNTVSPNCSMVSIVTQKLDYVSFQSGLVTGFLQFFCSSHYMATLWSFLTGLIMLTDKVMLNKPHTAKSMPEWSGGLPTLWFPQNK